MGMASIIVEMGSQECTVYSGTIRQRPQAPIQLAPPAPKNPTAKSACPQEQFRSGACALYLMVLKYILYS